VFDKEALIGIGNSPRHDQPVQEIGRTRRSTTDRVSIMGQSHEDTGEAYRRFVHYYVRVPLSLVTITIGYILEFLICLPFFLIMFFDGLFRKKI